MLKTHLYNELHFLDGVESTPTFLVYDRYYKKFKQLELPHEMGDDEELDDKLAGVITKAI